MRDDFKMDSVSRTPALLRQSHFDERIAHPHCTVPAPVLKVFRENFGNAIVLGVSPEVGVVPGESIGGHPEHRGAEYGFVRVEDGKLVKEIFRLTPRDE